VQLRRKNIDAVALSFNIPVCFCAAFFDRVLSSVFAVFYLSCANVFISLDIDMKCGLLTGLCGNIVIAFI